MHEFMHRYEFINHIYTIVYFICLDTFMYEHICIQTVIKMYMSNYYIETINKFLRLGLC